MEYADQSLQDCRKSEMDRQGEYLVNTRPSRDYPGLPTTLLQAILVDKTEPDQVLAVEKADLSLAAYVRAHADRVGRQKFQLHAWKFFAIHFRRAAYYRDMHAFARLKDVATALGASREYCLAWDYADSDMKEGA